MMKFRKKPVVIEAEIYLSSTSQRIIDWAYAHGVLIQLDQNKLMIGTLEGVMTADVGDFIIKGVKDEFYPCKPDIFYATYEAAE